jgi:hypothetical protein
MRRATLVLFAISLLACADEQSPRAVPQQAARVEPETPPQQDAGSPDVTIVPDAADDDARPDTEPTRDTAVEDVIVLTEGPPPDVGVDTEAPDVFTLLDTALPGIGDAPTP